jgi:hypothetical protein
MLKWCPSKSYQGCQDSPSSVNLPNDNAPEIKTKTDSNSFVLKHCQYTHCFLTNCDLAEAPIVGDVSSNSQYTAVRLSFGLLHSLFSPLVLWPIVIWLSKYLAIPLTFCQWSPTQSRQGKLLADESSIIFSGSLNYGIIHNSFFGQLSFSQLRSDGDFPECWPNSPSLDFFANCHLADCHSTSSK